MTFFVVPFTAKLQCDIILDFLATKDGISIDMGFVYDFHFIVSNKHS